MKPPETTCLASMSSAEDSPAKTLAKPITAAEDWQESGAGCGQSLRESFAFYDPVTRSLKTSQQSLFGGLEQFSATLPKSGSMRNGRLFRRARWVPHTCGTACSLWPTPRRQDGGRSLPKGGTWRGTCYYNAKGEKLQAGVESRMRFVIGPGPLSPLFTEWLMGFPRG